MLVIGQGNHALTDTVCREVGAWWECAPDPERESYALYGLVELGLFDIVDSRSKEAGARAEAGGYGMNYDRVFLSESSWGQVPGAAIIDSEGTLRWLHRGTHVGDTARLDAILAALAEVTPPGGASPPSPPDGRESSGG